MSQSVSRRSFLRTVSVAAPVLAVGCRTLDHGTSANRDFVRIRDGHFERGGKSFRFIGANFLGATTLGNPNFPGERARLVQELGRFRALGITNLRLPAGSEGANGLLMRPGVWNENALQGLDFILAEMAKRGLMAVLYLTNYWDWSGGMAAYVHWATGEPIPDPNKPGRKHTGEEHMRFAARFYAVSKAQELFREHISHLLSRRNTVNGCPYNEDPTIMSWQLANEPRPGTDEPATEANLPAFYTWIDETARFIKQLAPDHLISTGNEGIMGCVGEAEVYALAHATPAVDYLTLHLWIRNWGWLTEPRLGPQYEQAVIRALRHVEQHMDLAEQLGKPLVMEEFGISRDEERTQPGSPTRMREDYFERMFRCLLNSCKAGRALQGVNFWLWCGDSDHHSGQLDVNGVAAGDAATLEIIRRYARALNALAKPG